MKAVRATASGRVQGVFYRESALSQARELELKGWIQNLPDGRVEAFAQGEVQAVDDFVAWLAHGPSSAAVERVETVEAEIDADLWDFTIRG